MIHATFFLIFVKDNIERSFRHQHQIRQEKDLHIDI